MAQPGFNWCGIFPLSASLKSSSLCQIPDFTFNQSLAQCGHCPEEALPEGGCRPSLGPCHLSALQLVTFAFTADASNSWEML